MKKFHFLLFLDTVMSISQRPVTSMVLSKLIFNLKKVLLVKLWNFFRWTHSILKFSKLVFYALLARLDSAQSCLKFTENLLFSAKIARFRPFSLKKKQILCNSQATLRSQDVLEEHKRPNLRTSECCAFI